MEASSTQNIADKGQEQLQQQMEQQNNKNEHHRDTANLSDGGSSDDGSDQSREEGDEGADGDGRRCDRYARKGWAPEDQKAFWKQKRAERRARKRVRAGDHRTEQQARWAAMTPEEQAAAKAEAIRQHEARQQATERHEQQCAARLADTAHTPALYFDLAFWHTMNDSGKKSTIAQLKFSYSSLRKAAFPFRPVICGADGPATAQFQRNNNNTTGASKEEQAEAPPEAETAQDPLQRSLFAFEGFRAHPPVITAATAQNYFAEEEATMRAAETGGGEGEGAASSPSLPHPRRLVYLSADSPNVLTTIDPGACYIIGAFVDHNSKKGLTETTATANGIPTARLPIDETLAASGGGVGNLCKVLTINHVVDVMVRFAATGSWQEALAILPRRRQGT